MIIELDGSQHAEQPEGQRDAVRTAYLNEEGYRVLRFWKEQVTPGWKMYYKLSTRH